MRKSCIFWALCVVGISAWMNTGCIAGVHHHRVHSTVPIDDGQRAEVRGQVNSVDLGIIADFRYLRLGFPFEGHRRQIEVNPEGGGQFALDEVVELRAIRLDVPIYSLVDLSEEPSGLRYPGRMRRRHSIEIWGSGSVGFTPIHPSTATMGLVYYNYSRLAIRLYGGVSGNPFEGVERRIEGGAEVNQRRSGYAYGGVAGVEVTLAAGEYALELIQFFLDLDTSGRRTTDRWQ
jgi:hypothetical protein